MSMVELSVSQKVPSLNYYIFIQQRVDSAVHSISFPVEKLANSIKILNNFNIKAAGVLLLGKFNALMKEYEENLLWPKERKKVSDRGFEAIVYDLDIVI